VTPAANLSQTTANGPFYGVMLFLGLTQQILNRTFNLKLKLSPAFGE